VAHSAVSATLVSAELTATLPFDGDDIRRAGLSGSYTLTNLSILDLQYSSVAAIWQAQDLYNTAVYTAADFAATCFVLDAQASAGGTIGPSPSPNCNQGLQYASGTVVTLTAVPTGPFSFAGWGGATSGITNPITITITADTVVTARFDAPYHVYLPLVLRQ
jgi:hypothetical protein